MSSTHAQAQHADRDERATTVAVCLPALVAVAFYANTLLNGLVYDDAWLIERFGHWDPDAWARITQRRAVAYALQDAAYGVFGSWAPGYRIASIALHATVSSCVALLAARLTRSAVVAGVCGVLFAAHPVHVEAVASFTNVADVLAMGFLAVALWLLASPAPRASTRIGALVLMGLALHAKPVAAAGGIAMAPLMLASLRGATGADVRRAWMRVAGALAAATVVLAAIGLASGVLPALLSPESIAHHSEGVLDRYGHSLATSAAAWPGQLRLLFFPLRLSFDYPTEPYTSFGEAAVLLGLAMAIGWIALAVAMLRRAPLAAFAMVWVIVTFLPCANVLPLTQFFKAERYLYVPSFGVCLLAGLAVDAALRRGDRVVRAAVIAALIGVVAASGARTIARNRDWRDTASLAQASLRAGIESRRIHHMLGEEAWQRRDFEAAVRHFARAVALQPDVPWVRYHLAAAYVMQGDLDEAEREREIADRAPDPGPKALAGRSSLARAYLAGDHAAEGAAVLERLVADAPDRRDPARLLAWLRAVSADDDVRAPAEALRLLGQADDARANCLRAAALTADYSAQAAITAARRCERLATASGDERARRLALRLSDLSQRGIELRLGAARILELPR